MRFHHTKNKGDLGVLHAKVDLAEKGFRLLMPLTEHEAFDLVAYKSTKFLRVQVKYRAAVNGVIAVPFTTCWADRHGIHTLRMDRGEVVLVCVYCPDTRACYYVDPCRFRERNNVWLRITPTRNNQSKRVMRADDFREIPEL